MAKCGGDNCLPTRKDIWYFSYQFNHFHFDDKGLTKRDLCTKNDRKLSKTIFESYKRR